MSRDDLSYDQLIQAGWVLNENRGISSPRFNSVAFCLRRDGHSIACVQGYGVTRQAALFDAALEANAWLRVEQAMQSRPRVGGQQRRRRGRRAA